MSSGWMCSSIQTSPPRLNLRVDSSLALRRKNRPSDSTGRGHSNQAVRAWFQGNPLDAPPSIPGVFGRPNERLVTGISDAVRPQEGVRFVHGCDCSEGLMPDYTTSILKCAFVVAVLSQNACCLSPPFLPRPLPFLTINPPDGTSREV